MTYDPALHSNTIKSKGGWSLEMKELRIPCTLRSNWASTNNSSGGTPGRNNSLHETIIENAEINIIDSYMSNSRKAVLTIDHGLDSLELAATLAGFSKTIPAHLDQLFRTGLFLELKATSWR
jgi:hypothetical protein